VTDVGNPLCDRFAFSRVYRNVQSNSGQFVDPTVLAQAQRGDREAQATLYRLFAPMVFTIARRILGSEAAAQDALQDSFVEVIRKAAQFRGETDIRHWIRQIVVRKCLSQLRSPWVRRRVLPDGAGSAGDLDDLEAADADSADRLVARQELERALDRLPAMARAVVWLHHVEGYTHDEIGRLMGRSESFSKSQLARACARLREILEPEVIEDETDNESEPCLGVLKTV
jgi:RNA polymerase sigma factor (sigma-70 family)